jgi:hypothetical protein
MPVKTPYGAVVLAEFGRQRALGEHNVHSDFEVAPADTHRSDWRSLRTVLETVVAGKADREIA